jgi:hypothetical protein
MPGLKVDCRDIDYNSKSTDSGAVGRGRERGGGSGGGSVVGQVGSEDGGGGSGEARFKKHRERKGGKGGKGGGESSSLFGDFANRRPRIIVQVVEGRNVEVRRRGREGEREGGREGGRQRGREVAPCRVSPL